MSPDGGVAGPSVDLRGRSVLVTGGAGTIGSTLVEQLVGAGTREVVVLDNLARGRRDNLASVLNVPSASVRLVEGDIRDAGLVRRLTVGCAVVFHLAAIRITQCVEDPRLALEVLAAGTFNVFDAAAELGVQKVVFSSSASIYGQASKFPTPETHPPWGDDTAYGAAKTYGEGLLRSYYATRGLPGVALRYFNVYGPRMDVHGVYTEVLIRWMQRIETGLPPIILGDGMQSMDFVTTSDVARANLLAAVARVGTGAFNVASGRETTLRQLAALLTRVMDRPDLEPDFGPPRATINVARRLADTSRAAAELGFQAKIDLEEGLADLVTWWRRTGCGTAAS